jgi:hypothetical protein
MPVDDSALRVARENYGQLNPTPAERVFAFSFRLRQCGGQRAGAAFSRAFSSEVDTGSREENASKK